MLKYLRCSFIIFCMLYCTVLHAQNITGFSGSDTASKLTFNFYNPIIFGNQTFTNGVVNSGPYQLLTDTSSVFDSTLKAFDLDSIPEQMVFYNTPCKFYIKSNTLQNAGKAINGVSYTVTQGNPLGTLLINRLQQLTYTTTTDTLDFYIRFTAFDNKGDTVKGKNPVHFKVIPALPFETATFGVGGQHNLPDPQGSEFTVVTFDSTKTHVTLSLSGVKLSLGDNSTKAANDLINTNTHVLDTLNLYAETVVIKGSINLPGTNIYIYARDFILEDTAINGVTSFGSLNTTPAVNLIPLPSGSGNGVPGAAAGNINLHILNFFSNPGIRFILQGGDGQKGTDGSGIGGNGGILTSTIDVSKYAYEGGGYSGLGNASPMRGSNGSFVLNANYATWLHPNFFGIVANYYKEAYYAGITTEVVAHLKPYSDTLNNYVTNGAISQLVADSTYNRLKQITAEINQEFYNISNNLDYFGNPPGWVPMLSFEISYNAYQNEINHALNVMFLDQMVQTANNNLEQRVAALTQMIAEEQQDVKSNDSLYDNIAFTVIPDIKQKMQNNTAALDSLQQVLVSINNQLQQQAQSIYNSRHNAWGEALGVALDVCSMIPTPITEGIAIAGNQIVDAIGGNLATSVRNGQSIVGSVTGGLAPFISLATSGDFSDVATSLEDGVTSIGDGVSNILDEAQNINSIADAATVAQDASQLSSTVSNAVTALYNTSEPLIDSVSNAVKGAVNVYNSLVNVSSDELGSIKGQLIADDPQIGQIAEQMKDIQDQQQVLTQQLKQSCQQMLVAQNAVNTGLATISSLDIGAFKADQAWDHTLSVYSNNMRRKAFERLRKYYYYMAKAYEYRTLQPWPGQLDLTAEVNKINTLLDSTSSLPGSNPNNIVNLTASNLTPLLASIYQEDLQKVASQIYDYYESNAPSQTITSTYRLTKAEVAALNNGQNVTLNLVQNGVFRSSEEDIRIVALRVSKMAIKPINPANIGNYDQLDFTFNYPNYSRIKKNGQVYSFNNYNLNTQYPIYWSTRYDFNSQTLTNSYQSASDNSLLKTLLVAPGSTDNMLIYSQPAAWADISLNMDHFTNSNNPVTLDTLEVQVDYDYLPEPNNQVHVELNTNNKWFAPTFAVSTPDINKNKSGIGNVHRVYTKSSGDFVTVTAPQTYGQYNFGNWADRTGQPVIPSNDLDTSGGNTIKFSQANDQYLVAVYKFGGAILNIPDTVYLGDSLHYNLHLKNTGSGPLLWGLDSIAEWIDYSGNITGINDTTISLTFQKLPDSLKYRIGPFDVTSTTTEAINNYVYFVQGIKPATTTDNTNTDTTGGGGSVVVNGGDSLRLIYPNPTPSSNINISFVNPLNFDASLIILNMNGEFVMSAKLIHGLSLYQLDLSRLNNGNYYIKIFNNEGLSAIRQIVIQRR